MARILLVDDQRLASPELEARLAREGHQVERVASSAVHALLRAPPAELLWIDLGAVELEDDGWHRVVRQVGPEKTAVVILSSELDDVSEPDEGLDRAAGDA